MTGRFRRWGPWTLLVAVAVSVLIVGASRPNHLTLQQRTMALAGQVRCPVCQGQSAAQSQTPVSIQIRKEIGQELAAGKTPQQILNRLVASYSPSILEKPQTRGAALVVWVLPLVAVVAAIAGLVLAFRRWRAQRDAGQPVSVDDRELVAAALLDSRGPVEPDGAAAQAPRAAQPPAAAQPPTAAQPPAAARAPRAARAPAAARAPRAASEGPEGP
ncbi:MAG: cytochrome c-type biogenesis protein [Acidimicrobiales bacterium]